MLLSLSVLPAVFMHFALLFQHIVAALYILANVAFFAASKSLKFFYSLN